MGVADQYAGQEIQDTSTLSAELGEAEQMRSHLNEYRRMRDMQTELDELTAKSQALTDKIELARELPATILAQASIPVEGLTVEDGVPLIDGLPISNLSDGELLELCVDIAVSRPGQRELLDAVRAAVREELRRIQIAPQVEQPEQQEAGSVSDDVLGFLFSLQNGTEQL